MQQIFLEKLTSLQLVKKFPVYYRTLRFITAFTWSVRKVSSQLILKKVTGLEQWYLSTLQSTPLGTSHTYTYKSPHSVPILSQINSVYASKSQF